MRKSGVSLIEVVIVVAFISIISAVFIREFDPIDLARRQIDAKKKADLANIQQVIEKYHVYSGEYPKSSNTEPKYRIIRPDGTTANWGEQWVPYMNILPKDSGKSSYVYYADTIRQRYYLYASLERGGKDSDSCQKNGSVCRSVIENGIPADVCGGICNYGVTSRNVNP